MCDCMSGEDQNSAGNFWLIKGVTPLVGLRRLNWQLGKAVRGMPLSRRHWSARADSVIALSLWLVSA